MTEAELKRLAGTKTEANLKAAFAGESQAQGRLRDRRGRREGGLPRAGGAGRCAPV